MTNLTVLNRRWPPVAPSGFNSRNRADDAGDRWLRVQSTHYEVGCSTGAINGLGDSIVNSRSPILVRHRFGPGNTLQFDIPGLANQTAYNCAVRAVDDAGPDVSSFHRCIGKHDR